MTYTLSRSTIDESSPDRDTCIMEPNATNDNFILQTSFIMFCLENHISRAILLEGIASIACHNFDMLGKFGYKIVT